MKPDRKFKKTLIEVSNTLIKQEEEESQTRRPSRINKILRTVVR